MSTYWLFLDMNSFFASVEQQENPGLRGRPTIVVPTMADTTCAIAASYEAKRFGIRTGTGVREAKALCPGLQIVPCHTSSYRKYHRGIVEILNEMFATIRVLSVDEMACRISPLMRESHEELGRRVKAAIRERLGECLTCSVGIAPNIFLGKVASEIEKPDGLVVLRPEDIPERLYDLTLRDLPGIGRKMLMRLQVNRIMTVKDLYDASYEELKRATGSVVGKRWWFMIRGSQEVDYGQEAEAPRQSVGHSHVLPPKVRTREGAEKVLLRLLSKALRRMRSYGQAASSLNLYIRYASPHQRARHDWHVHIANSHADDDLTWFGASRERLLKREDPPEGYYPLMVGVSLGGLRDFDDITLSMFDRSTKLHALSVAVDRLNSRYPGGVDLASVYWLREHAPDRISFGASLLKEDHQLLSSDPSTLDMLEDEWSSWDEGAGRDCGDTRATDPVCWNPT
jgi:DNA polymerase-4